MLNYSRKNRIDLLNKADLMNSNEIRQNANAINLELSTPIYRIFNYDRFIELLCRGINTLVRPSMWEDPFENILFNHLYQTTDGQPIDVSNIRDSWYGQCWTDKHSECDGLWRVYSHNGRQRCVRVKTTVRGIFTPLYDGNKAQEWQYFIGKVEYAEESTIRKILEVFAQPAAQDPLNVNQMQLLLTKRKEFEYESEVRILYCKGADPNNHDVIFQYDINPNEVFEEVLLDPWCPDRLIKNCADEIFNAGYHGKVTKSQLYAPVQITTTLI